MSDESERLIEQYIRVDPDRPTPDEAIVLPARVRVWALIGHLRSLSGDINRVAHGYDVSEDAVKAAMAYYRRHCAVIDNRLQANVTPAAHAEAESTP